MLADIICIHQGEDGTVCGHHERLGVTHFRGDEPQSMFDAALDSRQPEPIVTHPFTPGRKCPTCDGSGYYWALWGESKGQKLPCPACADSPVRGYVRAE